MRMPYPTSCRTRAGCQPQVTYQHRVSPAHAEHIKAVCSGGCCSYWVRMRHAHTGRKRVCSSAQPGSLTAACPSAAAPSALETPATSPSRCCRSGAPARAGRSGPRSAAPAAPQHGRSAPRTERSAWDAGQEASVAVHCSTGLHCGSQCESLAQVFQAPQASCSSPAPADASDSHFPRGRHHGPVHGAAAGRVPLLCPVHADKGRGGQAARDSPVLHK